jgi:AcrR family transcriptional regulator
MRTLDPVKHEAKRRKILAAAANCFATRGYHDTRTADICAAAGVSSGNLFHYFPSKQAIFTAIFEQDGAESAAALEQANHANDPLAALLSYLVSQARQSSYAHLNGLMFEIVANARRDKSFAALLRKNDRQTHTGIVSLLKRAAASGQIDSSLDPAATAEWIMAVVEGVFVRASVSRSFRLADPGEMLSRLIRRFIGESGASGAPAKMSERSERSPA